MVEMSGARDREGERENHYTGWQAISCPGSSEVIQQNMLIHISLTYNNMLKGLPPFLEQEKRKFSLLFSI